MKKHTLALVTFMTLTGLMAHAGTMDLPVDGTSAPKASSSAPAHHSGSGALVSDSEAKLIIKAVDDLVTDKNSSVSCDVRYPNNSASDETRNDLHLGDFQSYIDKATVVLRKEDGQPALIFQTFDNNVKSVEVDVTTDESGKEISKIALKSYINIAEKSENVGTLANPHFVVVPAHGEINQVLICAVN